MSVMELEAVPKYVAGLKVIGTVAVYKSGLKLAACCRDILDAHKVAEALGISEPLIVPVYDENEGYVGGFRISE